MSLEIYCGGSLETNAYFMPSKKGILCFDAPEETFHELQEKELQVEALILTHGHYDHIWDAAKIQQHYQCPVWIHQLDSFMLEDTQIFSKWGIPPIEPVRKSERLPVGEKLAAPWSCGGIDFTLFHIPGHSPGSVAFYQPQQGILIGGDILFAGGVGRWDLPGGNQKDLISGIQLHLLGLPDGVKVYPGHGPATTVGIEKKTNSYLCD